MIGSDDALSAVKLTVSPDPTAAELAAIVAVLGALQPPDGAAPVEAMPWRGAARLAAVHREWPRPAVGGWARTARREMQHAEHAEHG